MFNANKLFVERFKDHLKLLNRYLRYIFNGHFMIALIFIIVVGAVYYQKWLETLGPNFPAAPIIAVIFGLLVTYTPLQLFLKEADKVFLIVKEVEMRSYFRLSLLYNYVFQLYLVALVIAAVSPLYTAMFTADSLHILYFAIVILVFKGWNMLIHFDMMKVRSGGLRLADKVFRFLLSVSIFYFLVMGDLLFAGVTTGLFFLLFINNYILASKQGGLAWDILIENDAHKLSNFYRLVSMFANVPQLKKSLKKRRIIAGIVKKFIAFKHEATYDYLYRITFIRSGDYLSMFVRLTLIGILLITFIPVGWLKVALALLFIYMTNFQMVSLIHHYQATIWLDLYPIEASVKQTAFISFMVQLTFIQTIVLAVTFIFQGDLANFFLMIALGTLFNYVFNYYYVKKWIEKTTS